MRKLIFIMLAATFVTTVGCSKKSVAEETAAICPTENLGITSMYRFARYAPQMGSNIAGYLQKWQWRQSNDTIVICGAGANPNSSIAYCFKKNAGCITYLYALANQAEDQTPITINADGTLSQVTPENVTIRSTRFKFSIQNYVQGINLTGGVGALNGISSNFWVDFTPETQRIAKFELETYTIIDQ